MYYYRNFRFSRSQIVIITILQRMKICKNLWKLSAIIYIPDMMKKPKIHLVLHLVECMEQFGPTSAFSTYLLCRARGLLLLTVKLSIHIFEHRIFMAIKVLQAMTSAITLLPLNS